ncbi:MAG: hypothetical protein L3K18_09465 [Thermoplasmata archaeon]|nr:hypothetical protein [Thermoplasmata archaeon]
MSRLKGTDHRPKARVTCSITFEDYEFVARTKLEFSALLAAAIRSIRQKEEGTVDAGAARMAITQQETALPPEAPTRDELPSYSAWLVSHSSEPGFMAIPKPEKFKMWRTEPERGG